MIENIRDTNGNYYYRKYAPPQPPAPGYSIEIAYEKIAEMIDYMRQMEGSMEAMRNVNVDLVTRISVLEEEKKMLERLRK